MKNILFILVVFFSSIVTGWVNGINPTNTPEVYTNDSEKTIFKGNGNFYEKHFNGTNDVFTLLS